MLGRRVCRSVQPQSLVDLCLTKHVYGFKKIILSFQSHYHRLTILIYCDRLNKIHQAKKYLVVNSPLFLCLCDSQNHFYRTCLEFLLESPALRLFGMNY